MFRLLALLPPPIRRLLTGQVLYDPYVQAPGSPGSPAASNQKAADRTSTLWSLCSGSWLSWLSCLLQSEGCWQDKYSMIPMFRLLALLPPPIRRLLTVQYSMIPMFRLLALLALLPPPVRSLLTVQDSMIPMFRLLALLLPPTEWPGTLWLTSTQKRYPRVPPGAGRTLLTLFSRSQ